MAWVIFKKSDLSVVQYSGITKDMLDPTDPRYKWASDYDPTVDQVAQQMGLNVADLGKLVHNNFDVCKYGPIVTDNGDGTYSVSPKPQPQPAPAPTPQPAKKAVATTDAPDVNPVNGRFEIPADGTSSAAITIQLQVEDAVGSGNFINDDGSSAVADVVDKNIGTGDGTTTTFSLGFTRIVDGSVTVKLDGVETTDFTVDLAAGTITFGAAPANGAVITASFQTNRVKVYVATTGGVLSDRFIYTDDTGKATTSLTSVTETKWVDVTVDCGVYGRASIPFEFIPVS